MPLKARNSARRRRETPREELPVMAPTRMKLRVRRRDTTSAGGTDGGQPEEEEERSRESSGRSSRRKNTSSASAATSSSPPSSSSASARAVLASEEASPDSKCPICLDRFNNLAYLDRCLHRFCFPCIQEWSHNKAECPLCKQPFASILHSVRAEDDFKEYTLRPTPANSSVAATVAMVAAMASAARSDHQMRLMLRRHRAADGGETTATRRRRRERGGESRRVGERTGVWEWYLDSPPLPLPPPPHHPAVSSVVAEDSEEGEDLGPQSVGGVADRAERGVIFEGLTGLTGAAAPVSPNDRTSRRLMTCLVTRQQLQRLQREGGTVRRLRERETVTFRRALYRSGIRVRGVAGVNGNQGQQQRDITAESFRRTPTHLNRLRPWLRRELTVLYGAHGSLVDIVQRIIMARLARHGLEDMPTIEEELRPFLLARTDHFLHELVSFARSPLTLDNYDLQAVYEPPAAAMELDGMSSSTDSSSVIAISEGEEGRAGSAHDDIIQTGSCLSLSAWDDETPGPSYSTAEPSCSLAPLSFSPAPQEAANEEGAEKREEEGEEECLIVGYKKPIAERTPELVQLSSDSEEEEEEEKKKKEEDSVEKGPPLSYLPTIPPSTSGAHREEDNGLKVKETEAGGRPSRVHVWSGSSGRSRDSACTLGLAVPSDGERRPGREGWRERKQPGDEAVREKKRRKKRRRRRGHGQSHDRSRKSGTLNNPNRSIYPAMMCRRSHSPSSFHSSMESCSPLPPSPTDSSWEYSCSHVSPLTSSISSSSRSSSTTSLLCSSPQLSPQQTPPTPLLSPGDRCSPHGGEKPGGKRKYKSRHLDSDDKDPTWTQSGSRRSTRKKGRGEEEGRRRGRERGRRGREQGRRRERAGYSGESSGRQCRDDRSPSVEIIYEGTVAADATRPPDQKRRRKRQRKSQHSSSPVIITLDSDSSHDDTCNKIHSSSSSPLSSQQTVDFSDLPPLPLVHSTAVGGAMDTEIGELPVNILDRESDASETEAPGQSEVADPIAVDNSDNSDHDVEVEHVESTSLLGSDNEKDDKEPPSMHGPIRKTVKKATVSQPVNENKTTPVDGGNEVGAQVSSSDSHLLASILDDLQGISASNCDLSSNFEPKCSSVDRTKSLRHRGHEMRHPNLDFPEQRQCTSSTDRHQGFDLLSCCPSVHPLPRLQRLKECRVMEEDREVPPLLKQASPVQLYNRNTPPPLKHKDAGSPRLSPVSPIDLLSPATSPVGVTSNPALSQVDSNWVAKDDQPIPPISTLKQHFKSTLALNSAIASTSNIAAIEKPSTGHLATIDSPSTASSDVGTSTISVHSTSHKPSIDSHSSSPGSNADHIPQLDFNSLPSSQLHSKDIPSSSPRSAVKLHPVNCLSPFECPSVKTGRPETKPTHTDSTSSGHRNMPPSSHSCWVSPVDLNPSSSISAQDTAGGSDVFSGVGSNDAAPLIRVSPVDSRSSSNATNREKLSEGLVGSVPPATRSGRLSPIDVHPRSPKSSVDIYSSGAASGGPADTKVLSSVNHDDRLPPIDLDVINSHSSFAFTTMGGHLNHTAISPSRTQNSVTSQAPQRKCSSEHEPTIDFQSKSLHDTYPDSKPHNHFDSSSDPAFPVASRSKHRLPEDSQPPVRSKRARTDCHIRVGNPTAFSPESAENRWNSTADTRPQSPADERTPNTVWNTHANSAT